ncbi:MAG TPA: polysaccharide deacetylase family protein [Pyrinomonadaceae bacterium]|jgi:peptidoglycan/xylan/chitin deacetylase (PgdA/CDA1 family)
MTNLGNTKLAIKQSLTWARLNGSLNDAVLFTFDDGPHPYSTPVVLELLKQYNARAIFFIVGARIQRAPHLLKTILDEGHALGNHSYTHPLEKQHWLGAYVRDLLRCQQAIEDLTRHRPRFFRPPLGTFSLTSLAAPRLIGLRTVLWSASANDWGLKSSTQARAAADALSEKLLQKPNRNDIVLMHDDHPYIGQILETLLPKLAAQRCNFSSALDSVSR